MSETAIAAYWVASAVLLPAIGNTKSHGKASQVTVGALELDGI